MCCTTHVPKDLIIMNHFENIDYTDFECKIYILQCCDNGLSDAKVIQIFVLCDTQQEHKKFFIPHIVFLYDILTYYSLIIHVYDFISP